MNEKRTKAEFRALRELVGMTQAALAAELGVEVRSVKRWEKPLPDGWYQPPNDAWDVLDEARERQREAVASACEVVDAALAATGRMPEEVTLAYWLGEGEYAQFSTDADKGIEGDWRMANANARVAASVLAYRGCNVRFVPGAGAVAVPATQD